MKKTSATVLDAYFDVLGMGYKPVPELIFAPQKSQALRRKKVSRIRVFSLYKCRHD
jgi:hypothetical protein